MYDREYNKTYKPFVAWLIGYPVVAIIAGIGLSEVSIKAVSYTHLDVYKRQCLKRKRLQKEKTMRSNW